MGLVTFTDRWELGATDVSARLISARLSFGGDPYSNQIYLSTGTATFDVADGATLVDDSLLRIYRPAVGSLAERLLWTGRARRNFTPKTAGLSDRIEYDLSGLLEVALGYQRTATVLTGDFTGETVDGTQDETTPQTLAQTVTTIVTKALGSSGLTIGRIDVATLTGIEVHLDSEDADGNAIVIPDEKVGPEWMRTIADITHTRPLEVNGNSFAITQGAANAANRTNAGFLSNDDVLMSRGALIRDDRTIQNVFQNNSFESQTPASVAEWGAREVNLPDWLPSGNHLILSASAPGVIIDFTAPRWQDTEAALTLLESCTIGSTQRIRIVEGTQITVDDYGAITRLTYTWAENQPPQLRVESVVYLYSATITNWILGTSRLSQDTRLA